MMSQIRYHSLQVSLLHSSSQRSCFSFAISSTEGAWRLQIESWLERGRCNRALICKVLLVAITRLSCKMCKFRILADLLRAWWEHLWTSLCNNKQHINRCTLWSNVSLATKNRAHSPKVPLTWRSRKREERAPGERSWMTTTWSWKTSNAMEQRTTISWKSWVRHRRLN